MKTFVYIFGPPGSGKTSLMSSVCSSGKLFYNAEEPIKHCAYSSNRGNFIVLGSQAVPFGGTDTLSYTAVASSNKWLKKLAICSSGQLVFGEGDRLANAKFFEEVRKHYRLLPFYLNCFPSVSKARRDARAEKYSLKQQSPIWVRGRITKHLNLAKTTKDVIWLDAELPSDDIAKLVWERVEDLS